MLNDELRERFRAGRPLYDGADIIDMHGHLGRCGFAIPDGSPAFLVAAMDRVGVASIICSHMQCMSVDTGWGNDCIAEAMLKYPGRIMGYFSVWPSGREAVEAEAGRSMERGFCGMKVHNSNGFAYDYADYEPAYEAVNRRRMPVLFHTWGGEAEFEQISRVARRHPDMSILLAHAGSANTGAYCRMAREHANVWLDLAFSLSPFGMVKQLVDGAGADKVVWGSDAVFLNLGQQLGKVVDADIDADAKRRILFGNARRIMERIR